MESEIVVRAGKQEKNYWADVWHFRELFYILAWRDIKVRYKQTVLGILWSVIRPLIVMVVFTIVFNKVAKIESGSTPYPVMVLAGLLPWLFFSTALTESSNSLIGNEKLITKVYFPRIIVPGSSVVTSLIDLLISFGLLVAVLFYYGYVPSWRLVYLPVFVLLVFLVSFGVGLWISALNVKYRDFRYIIPFIVQFGLYVSPVGFSSSAIPESYQLVYSLNPMTAVIDGFRWCIMGPEDAPLNASEMLISIGVAVFFLWLGIKTFRRMEKTFADLI